MWPPIANGFQTIQQEPATHSDLTMGMNTKLQGLKRSQFNCRMAIWSPCTVSGMYLSWIGVSIGMIAKVEYRMTPNESTWLIIKGNLRISHGSNYNNLYLLNMFSLEGSTNVAEMPTATLWHGWFGQMSQAKLDRLWVSCLFGWHFEHCYLSMLKVEQY